MCKRKKAERTEKKYFLNRLSTERRESERLGLSMRGEEIRV